MKRWTAGTLAILAALLQACGPGGRDEAGGADDERVVRVYNWSDYIADETIPAFETETGIGVVYDVFDSNEVLEAKLLSGASGYDVVVPSNDFMGRQIEAGVFQPLDKSKLPHYQNLDPELLDLLEAIDPGNRYGVPYLWGTTGLGYDVEAVRSRLGPDAPVDSLALLFDPGNAAKLADCGIAILDSAAEVFPMVLAYLGLDPNSEDSADYRGPVLDAFLAIRPHVRYFHSSQYINDLANGEICLAFGWSGDILQAAARAREAGNGVEIAYRVPTEGAEIWFDLLAVPRDARHVDEAHAFIDHLLQAPVIAEVTNEVRFANANEAATPLVEPEILDHPGIYPGPGVRQRLFTVDTRTPEIDRVMTRVWTEIKTGQ